MTLVRQVKYYILVVTTACIVSAYFTLSYFMVTSIFEDSQKSLTILDTVSDRGPYLDSLITYYLQSLDRESEIEVYSLSEPETKVNAIDYYYDKT